MSSRGELDSPSRTPSMVVGTCDGGSPIGVDGLQHNRHNRLTQSIVHNIQMIVSFNQSEDRITGTNGILGDDMSTRVNQRPTQRQIANQVGVSVTTVSRILNPDETQPERWASVDTVEAIRTAAAELGYRRNALAVSLRTSRSQTIGVLLPMIGDYTFATMFSGIDEVARENGIMAITASTRDEPTLRSERTFKMLDHLVDGMIFADAHLDEQFLDELDSQKVPFTLVHRRHPRHVSVTADDVSAGKIAAEHLMRLGRTRLAVVAAKEYMSTGTDRVAGFVQAALDAGLPKPDVYTDGFSVRAGRDAALKMMSLPEPPDGIFCIHDLSVLGAISVFKQHGMTIPDDVACLGFYDSPMAWASEITSIGVDLKQMGRRSLELLMDRLSGKSVASEVLPVSLFVRQSTDPTQVTTSNLPT